MLFLVILAPLPSPAQRQIVSVPFRSVNTYMLVQASIDGTPVTLLVDTGANKTILNARSIGRVQQRQSSCRSTSDGKQRQGHPGVDQEIWDTPEKKTQAVHALKRRGYRSQPLRRVYIPKSDGKTMRPLGIPAMIDRGQQALHLLALDPVVETTADRNSYGFRQRRSCADAIGQCFLALRRANA